MSVFKLTFIFYFKLVNWMLQKNIQCNTEIKMVNWVTLTHFKYDAGLWNILGTAVMMRDRPNTACKERLEETGLLSLKKRRSKRHVNSFQIAMKRKGRNYSAHQL